MAIYKYHMYSFHHTCTTFVTGREVTPPRAALSSHHRPSTRTTAPPPPPPSEEARLRVLLLLLPLMLLLLLLSLSSCRLGTPLLPSLSPPPPPPPPPTAHVTVASLVSSCSLPVHAVRPRPDEGGLLLLRRCRPYRDCMYVRA